MNASCCYPPVGVISLDSLLSPSSLRVGAALENFPVQVWFHVRRKKLMKKCHKEQLKPAQATPKIADLQLG